MMRAFNVYYGAIKSADNLTTQALDEIHRTKPNDRIARKIYDRASRMSLDIRADLKECAETGSSKFKVLAIPFNVGQSYADFLEILDRPDKWPFEHTGETLGSKEGSYGHTWLSGQDYGIDWPIPAGIATFLDKINERGQECFEAATPATWERYLNSVKMLRDAERWEDLKDQFEWAGRFVEWVGPKLWSLMKIEEKGEKYNQLMTSTIELGGHTKEYMDSYLEASSYYSTNQAKIASKQYCADLAVIVEKVLSGAPPFSFGFGRLYATVIAGVPGLMDFFNKYSSSVNDPFSAAAKYYPY